MQERQGDQSADRQRLGSPGPGRNAVAADVFALCRNLEAEQLILLARGQHQANVQYVQQASLHDAQEAASFILHLLSTVAKHASRDQEGSGAEAVLVAQAVEAITCD